MGLWTNERLLVGTRDTSRASGRNLGVPDLMACVFLKYHPLTKAICYTGSAGEKVCGLGSLILILLDLAKYCSPGKLGLDSALCPGQLFLNPRWVASWKAFMVTEVGWEGEGKGQGWKHRRKNRNRSCLGQVLEAMINRNPEFWNPTSYPQTAHLMAFLIGLRVSILLFCLWFCPSCLQYPSKPFYPPSAPHHFSYKLYHHQEAIHITGRPPSSAPLNNSPSSLQYWYQTFPGLAQPRALHRTHDIWCFKWQGR